VKPEELFGGVRPPRAGEALRDRVLEAARAAMGAPFNEDEDEDAGPGFIDRLWESRPLRLGWAALCVALIAGHAALSPAPAPVAAPLAAAESAPEELGISRELLSQAQLERLQRQDPGPERPTLMEMEKERL